MPEPFKFYDVRRDAIEKRVAAKINDRSYVEVMCCFAAVLLFSIAFVFLGIYGYWGAFGVCVSGCLITCLLIRILIHRLRKVESLEQLNNLFVSVLSEKIPIDDFDWHDPDFNGPEWNEALEKKINDWQTKGFPGFADRQFKVGTLLAITLCFVWLGIGVFSTLYPGGSLVLNAAGAAITAILPIVIFFPGSSG